MTLNIAVQPPDLSTSVGDTPLRIWLDNHGYPLSADTLQKIADSVQLHTLSGVPVDLVTSTYNPKAESTPVDPAGKGTTDTNQPQTPDDRRGYVEVAPAAKLVAEWYVLSLKEVPSAVVLDAWSAPSPPQGVYASRFRVDEYPLLIRAIVCNKAPGKSVVKFEFSETVEPQSVVGGIKAFQKGVSCAQVEASGSTSARTISLACDGASEDQPWHIIGNGLALASSGKTIRLFDGSAEFSFEFLLAELKTVDGCRAWRPF